MKHWISKNELVADIVFLLVAMAISGIALYVFDIHWNFYPGGQLFPPEKHIFQTPDIYYLGIPLGGIIGFVLLKAVNYAFLKEEEEHLQLKRRKKRA